MRCSILLAGASSLYSYAITALCWYAAAAQRLPARYVAVSIRKHRISRLFNTSRFGVTAALVWRYRSWCVRPLLCLAFAAVAMAIHLAHRATCNTRLLLLAGIPACRCLPPCSPLLYGAASACWLTVRYSLACEDDHSFALAHLPYRACTRSLIHKHSLRRTSRDVRNARACGGLMAVEQQTSPDHFAILVLFGRRVLRISCGQRLL